jgi:hypothetical protein
VTQLFQKLLIASSQVRHSFAQLADLGMQLLRLLQEVQGERRVGVELGLSLN